MLKKTTHFYNPHLHFHQLSKISFLASFISFLTLPTFAADNQLGEITVVEYTDKITTNSINLTTFNQIKKKQPRNIKDLLANELDIQVNDLQRTRSGNDGVNIRGLQGNRVAMTIDGISLAESQENKLFVTYGQDFGRGDFIEPTGLRSALVNYSGSYQSLSGGIDFQTLDPKDLYKDNALGGFIDSGFDSVDTSWYLSAGGAVHDDKYEGMVIVTGRFGHETKNNADSNTYNSDPANYKNSYVLTKHIYHLNEHNSLKLTFENKQKTITTNLLSSNDTIVPSTSNQKQISGYSDDTTRRTRISLNHQYQNENGWLQQARNQLYLQNSLTDQYRKRTTNSNYRQEYSNVKTQALGFQSDLVSNLNTELPQQLRYGFAFNYTNYRNNLNYTTTIDSNVDKKPTANTKQTKTYLYIEDELLVGDFAIIPRLGGMYFVSNPSNNGYNQGASEIVAVEKQHKVFLLPKLAIEWRTNDLFTPYLQYSRGVKTPSSQQLTSSFYENPFGNIKVAVVGNGKLQAETADNFDLGLKGQNETIQYRVNSFYNHYKNFINAESLIQPGYTYFIQYQNLDKAKIYGVTADVKWQFYDNTYLFSGVTYSRGKATNNGKTTPINTIQPLKLKIALSYEAEQYGGNIAMTHIRKKNDSDINGTIYNPTATINIVDLGIYWKPTKNLMLTANINNLFDKKYWNWADISYFAVQKDLGYTGDRTASLDRNNADYYTAPGRNFNVGIRYEF